MFRNRCAGCHGPDAHGYLGPDLTAYWAAGGTDDRMFDIVRSGVPGTEMIGADPQRVLDKDIWQMLAYIRTLSAVPPAAPTGDAANGERVFRANCSSCHRVNGRGGQLGPDLSRIGSARPRAGLSSKIRGSSDVIRPGYEPVTLVTRDGERIRGVRKNEDEFSIQIMDARERLQGYLKANLTAITFDKQSLMPVYGPDRLNDRDARRSPAVPDVAPRRRRGRSDDDERRSMRDVRVRIVTATAGRSRPRSRGRSPPRSSRPASVTAQDLRDGLKNPTRWLTYGGDYGNHRHSPLTQITPANVNRLTPQWQFQTDTLGKFEAAPLVLDGVVYMTGPLDTGWAIDARTGRQIWRYRRDLPNGLIACCGLVNRGFGVLGDRLFKTTLDAHVVAISRKTGAIEWDTAMENFRHGYSGTTAPLVVKDKVIVGIAGAEYGVRGFIDAYDAQTGQAGLAVLHDRRPRGSRPRHVARHRREGVGARRRIDLGARRLRSRAQSHLLGHRQCGARLQRPASAKATTCTPHRSWRSTPTRASCAGTINSRRTTSGTTTRRRCRCSPIHARRRAAQGRAVRQSQRLLLRARSRDRQADPRQAVHPDDVGEGDSRRRPADAPAQQRAERARARKSVPISPAGPTGCRRRSIPRSVSSS